jgi:hypothetical protein
MEHADVIDFLIDQDAFRNFFILLAVGFCFYFSWCLERVEGTLDRLDDVVNNLISDLRDANIIDNTNIFNWQGSRLKRKIVKNTFKNFIAWYTENVLFIEKDDVYSAFRISRKVYFDLYVRTMGTDIVMDKYFDLQKQYRICKGIVFGGFLVCLIMAWFANFIIAYSPWFIPFPIYGIALMMMAIHMSQKCLDRTKNTD